METRFILPATLAAALHVLVLYGVKVPPTIRDPAPPPASTAPKDGPVVVEIEDPPEIPVDAEKGAEPPKGDPDSFHPELEETPPRPGPYEQTVARVNPRPEVNSNRISAGPPGILDGVISGIGTTIINSRFLDNPPRTRVQIPPAYPTDAKMAGVTGQVSVEFIVDENGRVHSARVVESSDVRFDAATIKAVQKWRFEPGKKNGRPVRFRMVAPVVFSLDA